MKDSLAILATLAASASAALEPVTVKGNAFFAGNERFYMRGIDYQPGGASDATDPLANPSTCKRDIPYFKELGLNTIRVYTVDNSKNHDECMKALDDAGIYLALDVNTPLYSLNREDPEGSYNDVYLQSVFATMEMFAEYDNTLLFFSGNEVINAPNNTNCAPYVKATTRDMKSYIAARGLRNVPVGYSAADVDDNRFEMASYMNCGTDDQRSDFFAFNDYSWCAPSSFTKSGWDQKVKQYNQYSIPLFLSEFGCITNTRDFGELEALYSSQMSSVYSGGLVYEYSEEGSGYGLVNLNGNTVKELPDFAALKSSLQENTISGDGGYKQNLSPSKCPPSSNTWEVDDFSGADLPAIPDGAVKYLNDGAGKGPGLNGDGSQWATDGASDSTASPGSGEGSSASSSSSSSSSNGAGALALPSLLLSSIIGCSAYLLVAAF